MPHSILHKPHLQQLRSIYVETFLLPADKAKKEDQKKKKKMERMSDGIGKQKRKRKWKNCQRKK